MSRFGRPHGAFAVALWLVSPACATNPGPPYAFMFWQSAEQRIQPTLGPHDVAVPHGLAFHAIPIPVGPDGKRLVGEVSHVVLSSEDPSVLELRRLWGDDGYVFIGAQPGETVVHVVIQEVEVDQLRAVVNEQPP